MSLLHSVFGFCDYSCVENTNMKQDGGWRCSLFITILDRRGPPQFITILHRGPSIYVTEVESDLSSHTWVESVINGQPHSTDPDQLLFQPMRGQQLPPVTILIPVSVLNKASLKPAF